MEGVSHAAVSVYCPVLTTPRLLGRCERRGLFEVSVSAQPLEEGIIHDIYYCVMHAVGYNESIQNYFHQ